MNRMVAAGQENWLALGKTSVPEHAMGSHATTEPEYKGRILVVDDVFDNRDILVRRLSRRGFEVLEAAGGREALEMIAVDAFDVVLLDIMMPDLSGNEVLRAVRETRSATELPIIMVTAKSQSEDVVESLNLGANDYVIKPVDFAVALVRINQQVALKRTADMERTARRVAEEEAAKLRLAVDASSRLSDHGDKAFDPKQMERQQAEERLRHLAYHDVLTGLLNRTSFRERLNEVLHDPIQLVDRPVLLFLDLDRFKSVNDLHGHAVGDKLLQQVSTRLRAAAGSQAPIARLGGDEFAVLLFEDDADLPIVRAERIVAALSDPFDIDGRQLQIGASCGIAKAADCANDLDALSRAADLAMYQAKSAGRGGCIVYQARMLSEQHERNELELELRQAIREGALDVVYQPMISSVTKQVTAFEALARWPHSTRGMIPPDTFIPLAEETGLIVALGAWVLRRACSEAATWPAHVRVAVNVSALQFRSPDLLPTIADCLTSNGIEPSRLEIEITESVLLEARGRDIDIFRAIQALGVRISMDDFGTGYSSLSYLQSFEFDKIKLDRQFVRRAQFEVTAQAIVKAIVALAGSSGMETTAEGVETAEEVAVMTGHGCTEVQGYFLSRPLTPDGARSFAHGQSKNP